MSRQSSLKTSSTRSLTSKFTLSEPLMDVALESPLPSQGQALRNSLFDSTQDGHARGSDCSDSFHDRVENSLYGSQMPRPHPKCSLDISADRYLTNDGPGAPPNPHNTPASNSEQTSHGSSEAESCHGQNDRDIHVVSDSKAENLNIGWMNESRNMYAGYWIHGDEKVRRRRQPKSSITDTEYGVFSPGLDPLDHVRSSGVEELDDATPPFMRSPQFSPPPSSFRFRPPRIRFLRQHSSTRKSECPSTERQKKSLRPPKSSRRRHIHRPYPYRTPARPFHIPMEHTERFPIPFPSILKLPFRRESPAGQLIDPSVENRKNKNIKKLLQSLQGDFPIWHRLREYTVIRLSLHKSSSSSTDSIYICYLRFRGSTFSINFSHTAKPEEPQSPTLIPTRDGTVVLFQISFLIPVLIPRLFELFASVVRRVAASKAVFVITSSVGVAMSMLTAFIFFALKKLRLGASVGLEVS
ncbi:hypothetical protein PHISCL_07412 [Aspergillus sclerotialis]|uniref:Uncharacterized protein n=1 Tax=Aspergillus sclerotialis TaxID=2070753 RepID=A0A3A2ZQR0_9EURO|nr:hypothetical protein PHISCL_07412 [Aspergillus sclerotialis]